jgi:hypothetical protein
MPTAGRSQTVEDGLGKIFTDAASLQLLPDAAPHAQFLAGLQKAIQTYLTQFREKSQQQAMQAAQGLAGQAGPGGGGPPGMTAPMGAGAGPGGPGALPPPPGPAQFGPGGASGGGSPGPVQMPNPDELRRVLAGSSGTVG